MSNGKATPPRRKRVPGPRNSNIYERPDGKLEIGYRDSAGKQRFKTIQSGGIIAARAERDKILGDKARGERVVPNPRLRFGEAANRWLDEHVVALRKATRDKHRNSIEKHLRPRWGRRRLDSITVDDAAKFVRELRAEGAAEWTIQTILLAASRVFRFARRRLSWHGDNPVALLDASERPKVSQTARRRIFHGDELAQTIAAAGNYRTLLALAAVTGARISELLGLTWSDLDLANADEATVTFRYQLDREGRRSELKTEASRRTVELPRTLAMMLLEHRDACVHTRADDFVFATRSGTPLNQRNAARALRNAMKAAKNATGRPTFPILHEHDRAGSPVPVPRGAVPSWHSFRHTAASRAIAAGDSAEEVSWLLGHKDSTVTRAVYIQELKDVERRARNRARMEERYGEMLGAVAGAPDHTSSAQPDGP